MSASSSAVNTLVTEAISNTVSAGQRTPVGAAGIAIGDDSRALLVEHADDDAHAAFRSGDGLDALLEDPVNITVGGQSSRLTAARDESNEEE